MTIQQKIRMAVEQYFAWAVEQPSSRWELVDGEPLKMAPVRARHNIVKFRVCKALEAADKRAGAPCEVFTDGMTVVINEHTAREPDASVQCGIKQDLDSMVLPSPTIVVEVASPSNPKMDTNTKLAEYFTVPSIQHYLIVLPNSPAVIHHQRGGDGAIRTTIIKSGEIPLDPPGITLPIAGLWPDEAA